MHTILITAAVLFLFSSAALAGHAELIGLPAASQSDSSGIVSAVKGHAAAVVSASGISRELKIGDRVAAGEHIHVGPAGSLELLWERRALFTLEERTRIGVQESKNGSASLQILDGAIRIAYSYNEGHPTDTLKIQTPGARMVLRGGIIEAAVGAAGVADQAQGSKGRSGSGRTTGEVLRVIEGQAQIEPRAGDAKPFLLKAGYEVQVSSAGSGSDAIRPSAAQGVRDLVIDERHQHVPESTVQRVVQIHVEHALELERALNKPSRNGSEPEQAGTGIKGAIVATSLGIPLTAISASAGTLAGSISTPAVSPGPVAGGPGPVAVPPVSGPIVQAPGVTALTPSQSGGINSLSLLRDVLQDASRGRGRGRGRDRD